MKNTLLRGAVAAGCFLLSACAVITVNVYFPEKAAKEAYKSLDEMLLKSGKKGGEKGKPQPAPAAAPEAKPQSRLFELPSLSLAGTAWAADGQVDADALAVEMSSMPEVLKAYDDMSHRLPRLNTLFASGAVGLSSQGLIAVREKGRFAPLDQALVSAENQSRKTVVTAMAKAILKLNHQKESKAALDQVLGKAAATFAETKREAAQPGWWMQLPNGNWVQK